MPESPTVPDRSPRLLLISIGIGDPDNMTVRAQRALAGAEVVFCMPGVGQRIQALLEGKEVHDAGHGLFTPLARRGKTGAEVDAQEAEVRRTLRQAANDGKTIAVLDYGDPCLYGPQAGYLREFQDLAPTVIPGISSFNAANAALARPLATRQGSNSVILATARQARPDYDGRDSLARLAETRPAMAIFTMGIDLPQVVSQLSLHYAGDTPVAIVAHAGAPEQQSVRYSTLDSLIHDAEAAPPPFEHLIYIGDFLR